MWSKKIKLCTRFVLGGALDFCTCSTWVHKRGANDDNGLQLDYTHVSLFVYFLGTCGTSEHVCWFKRETYIYRRTYKVRMTQIWHGPPIPCQIWHQLRGYCSCQACVKNVFCRACFYWSFHLEYGWVFMAKFTTSNKKLRTVEGILFY